MSVSKAQIYAITFLCYTSIHALRTSYSQSKSSIAKLIQVQPKIMGIADSLMLLFLGIGHYYHAIRPMKTPIRNLWIAMVACSINFCLIPICLSFQFFSNFLFLAVSMMVNGFLQSYTWPTLLMIINSQYQSKQNSTLLGLWSTNANFGNIIGYLVFQFIHFGWRSGLTLISIYALINGIVVGSKINESILNLDQKQISKEQNLLTNKLLTNDQVEVINNENELEAYKYSVLKDERIILITICFALIKSVIYGIMLWLPLYFHTKIGFDRYASSVPSTYDIFAILGSVFLGYFFSKTTNKGLLMMPFIVILIGCFFCLRFMDAGIVFIFCVIAVVGFCIGGTFNTLAGLVVIELTLSLPSHLKNSSLGFYSALTMAVGNITTAITQILIGFVIGKQHPEGIFSVFMIYSIICLVCLIKMSIFPKSKEKQQNLIEMTDLKKNQNQRMNFQNLNQKFK